MAEQRFNAAPEVGVKTIGKAAGATARPSDLSDSNRSCSARELLAQTLDVRVVAIGSSAMSERLLSLVTQLVSAQRLQDWDGIRALLHPEALIGVFAAGGQPETPDVALAALEEAHDRLGYYADISRSRVLDDKAVIMHGYVRRRIERGWGYQEVERVWLYVFVDGLLYRSAVFDSGSDALDAYAKRGPDLGFRANPESVELGVESI